MEVTMYDRLLQLPLFQGICRNDFTKILEKVKLHFHKYPAGGKIVCQGEVCDRLVFILNGRVQSNMTDRLNRYAVQEIMESPYVIEPYSLFGMQTYYAASYEAYSDTDVVTIDKSYILTHLNNYEIFRLNYLNILSNRAQTLQNRLQNLQPGCTCDKIIDFLLFHCNSLAGTKTLFIKMEVLAKLIGDTRLNVSNALNELQRESLVELSRKKVVIPDMERLAERRQQE